ncbi:MAG: cyclic pyranopterin monophosphate synthase MoaC [Planctomycetes bacterium]|nr:cyclic pyranopterin monophosphate synthase MoaC [Planctomycetota bacterium]
MVDVGAKAVTRRRALASGRIRMLPATLDAIRGGAIGKGDVLAVARIAAIQAGKDTARLIPLCHSLPLDVLEVDFAFHEPESLEVRVEARTSARTGVEMEALTTVAAALLTIYDMCKAIDRGMEIGPIALLEKEGGRSGRWVRGKEARGRG